jgi:hypothetical protein
MAKTDTPEKQIEILVKALEAERTNHKAAEIKLKAADATIAEHAALGNAPDGAVVSEHIANGVRAGVAQQTADLQKRIGTLESELITANATAADVSGKLVTRSISEEVRAAALAAHVLPSAINDLLSLGRLELELKDGVVQTAEGVTVADWLDASKATRGYMWPAARGSGARGSSTLPADSGDNPFKAETFNLTAQSQLAAKDPARATRLQQEANATMSR